MRRVFAAVALVATSTIAAQHERVITPGGTGPNRLDVDVALLAGAAPDLPDVRLIDRDGQEVGYLLIHPQPVEPIWRPGTILDVASTKRTSGFEADLGSIVDVGRLRIGRIRPPYLKHVTLEGSGDRAHWTRLADTTVFDLPDQKLRRPEIAFAAGSYRYLRVTWDDRNSARVIGSPSAEARLHDAGAPPEALRAPMAFQKLSSEPSKSRFRINLPGPHLPIDAIEIEVAGGDVFRSASVTEPQLTNGAIVPVPLGSSQLRRAVRDGFVAAEMSIPIHAPSGRELQLIIDDGANPPLPVSRIVARFAPQPWIYFESPDASPVTVRYGDERAQAPQYDLEAARQYVGKTAVAFAQWSNTPERTLQPEVASASAVLPNVGAAVDRASFRYARPLKVTGTGLVILPLDADVLARSQDLADVRIVDASSRQIPYIVERRDEPLAIALAVSQRDEAQRGVSRYHFQLPYATLPGGTRLVIRTPARVFERRIRLLRPADETHGREETEIAQATWRNADPDTAPAPLTFDSTLHGTARADVEILDGDNAPLPLSSAELLLPSYALRFANPGGALTLLYGNSSASAPRYDLALLTPRILTEPAREISIARAITERKGTETREVKYFWIAIAAAAVVLLALLVRLLQTRLEETRPLPETPGRRDSPS